MINEKMFDKFEQAAKDAIEQEMYALAGAYLNEMLWCCGNEKPSDTILARLDAIKNLVTANI